MKTYQLIRIAVLTALLIVAVMITPPFTLYGIPFSLQPFLLALFAFILDWRTALAITTLYILIGLLGLPVFSGGKNGIGAIASGTIGFVIGFIPYTILISIPKYLFPKQKPLMLTCLTLLFALFSLVILYFCGFLSFHFISKLTLSKFSQVMTPFFFLDLFKISIALIISISLKPLIAKYR